MSAFKSAPPRAKGFDACIVVPTNKLLAFRFQGTDTYTAEQYFAELAKYQEDPDKREDCEKCQLTLKWANTCNAALKHVAPTMDKNNVHGVAFTFAFTEFCDLEMFVRNLERTLA